MDRQSVVRVFWSVVVSKKSGTVSGEAWKQIARSWRNMFVPDRHGRLGNAILAHREM